MVLAATNFPWDIDEACRRRLEKRIYIPLPDAETRQHLFRINLKDIELAEDLDMDELARSTDGYTGSDITNICRDACMMSMRRAVAGKTAEEIRNLKQDDIESPVTMADFQESLRKVQRSVASSDLLKFEKWKEEFGAA